MLSQVVLSLAVFAASVAALPAARSATFKPPTTKSGCSVPASLLKALIPAADQATLIPPSAAPNYLALGVGVQNYTCSAAGTFTNVGAVAELFDISCLVGKYGFDTVHTDAYAQWSASSQTTEELIAAFKGKSFIDGQHYFIPNPSGTGNAVPKFDFTSAKFNGNAAAFAVLAKAGDVAAPSGSADVDWLMLNASATSGSLATQIFRVNTVAGTDGAACTSGQTASVKYVAEYFFYGSKL